MLLWVTRRVILRGSKRKFLSLVSSFGGKFQKTLVAEGQNLVLAEVLRRDSRGVAEG